MWFSLSVFLPSFHSFLSLHPNRVYSPLTSLWPCLHLLPLPSLQCTTLRCCGQQPTTVESGLWDNPIGLSGGEGWQRLLSSVGPDRGDSSYFPSPAASQSHVPEQLRRPPQPRAQGTNIYFCSDCFHRHSVDSTSICICLQIWFYNQKQSSLTMCTEGSLCRINPGNRISASPEHFVFVYPGAGHSVIAKRPAQSVHGTVAEHCRAPQSDRHSQTAQPAADWILCSDHLRRHAADRAVQPQRWDCWLTHWASPTFKHTHARRAFHFEVNPRANTAS